MSQILIDTIGNSKITRGDRPASLDAFKALNAQTVICLEQGWFDFFHNKTGIEASWADTTGCTFLNRPMSDFTAPTVMQLRNLVELVVACTAKGNVHFHCLAGVDRTGMVAAAYRIYEQGWTADKAIQEMYSLGFHTWIYSGWVATLRQLV